MCGTFHFLPGWMSKNGERKRPGLKAEISFMGSEGRVPAKGISGEQYYYAHPVDPEAVN